MTLIVDGGSAFSIYGDALDSVGYSAYQVVVGGLDVTGLDDNGVQWSLDKMAGWGRPASTIKVVQKPRQPGSWAGLAYDQARRIGLSGQVAAPTQDLLTDALDRLDQACDLDSFTMTVVEGSRTRSMIVRNELTVEPSLISDKMASWTLQLVACDPRKFGPTLTNATGLPAVTGGRTIPYTLPATLPSQVVSGSVNLTNPGNQSGPVMLRIDGPCVGPVITHTSATTTKALVFSSTLTLGVGEFLLIDMDNRTVLANGQTSRRSYVTSAGWSTFDAGANSWAFTASGYSSASLLTVTATPAWK